MVTRNMLCTYDGKYIWRIKKIKFALDLIEFLNKSNNSDCSLRVQLFLISNLMKY